MGKTIKTFVFAAALGFAAVSVTQAESRTGDQGLGAMLGSPTGLSYKMWLDENLAIDAALGVSHSEVDTHLSLLWHNFSWIRNMSDKGGTFDQIAAQGELPFYVGIGPRVLFEDEAEIGIRVPLGLSFLPNNSTWEFFGEIAPIIRLTPSGGFNGDFAIGARYYFPAIRPRSK